MRRPEQAFDGPNPILPVDLFSAHKINVESNAKYRWEVSFLGDEIGGYQTPNPPPLGATLGTALGPALLESVSHVSKNAVDLP